MNAELVLEIALKSALIAGAALGLLALIKRRPAAQRAFVAHIGLALSLMVPFFVLFGPRLELTGPWSRTPAPVVEAPVTTATTSIAAALPASAPALSGELIGFGLYAAIAGLLLAALVVSLWRLLRLQRDATVLTQSTWLCALAQVQQRMGMKQGTALLESDRLSSPVSWGLLRPTIMVNPAILPNGEKAEAVLAHELAHVVRMDWLNLLIARLATALLWFNPLVWLLAWQAHELREEAADDVVLRGDVRRSDYAALLVDFARRERTSPLAAAHGVSPSKTALKRRLNRVLDPNARRDPAAPAWGLACATGALLVAAPVAAFTPIDHAPQIVRVASDSHPGAQAKIAEALATTRESRPVATVRAQAARAEVEPKITAARSERISPETLAAMRANGVTPDFIKRIERAYPPARHMDYDKFAGFAALGVTPEFLGDIAAAGYPNLPPDQVQGFAAVGVNRAYIGELLAAGFSRPSADALIGLRANGATADYIDRIKRAYPPARNMDSGDFVSFAALGVTPEWLRDIAEAGYPDLRPEQVKSFAALGVSPSYIRELHVAGMSRLSADVVLSTRALKLSSSARTSRSRLRTPPDPDPDPDFDPPTRRGSAHPPDTPPPPTGN